MISRAASRPSPSPSNPSPIRVNPIRVRSGPIRVRSESLESESEAFRNRGASHSPRKRSECGGHQILRGNDITIYIYDMYNAIHTLKLK